jgi:uncharacterized alpha/beta hydrolase family protein
MTKKEKKKKRVSFAWKMGRKEEIPEINKKFCLDARFNAKYNTTRF